MHISAISSVSNNKKPQNKLNTFPNIMTSQIAFKANAKNFSLPKIIGERIQKLKKLISTPKLSREELLKTYTKEEDLGTAIKIAFKLQHDGKVKKDIFSPELQKILDAEKDAQKQLYGNQKVFQGIKAGKEQYSYSIEEDSISINKIISAHFL